MKLFRKIKSCPSLMKSCPPLLPKGLVKQLQEYEVLHGYYYQLAKLSSYAAADSLVITFKKLAEMTSEPYTEFMCKCYKEAITDLLCGTDVSDVIYKFDVRLFAEINRW